jgi:hypothetical protein
MTIKDIIKLLPAKKEFEDFEANSRRDTKRGYNTCLDEVSSALSKITADEDEWKIKAFDIVMKQLNAVTRNALSKIPEELGDKIKKTEDDCTSALSKITIPEMATEEEIIDIIDGCYQAYQELPSVIDLARALVGKIPKPEGKEAELDLGLLKQCQDRCVMYSKKITEYRVALEKIAAGNFSVNPNAIDALYFERMMRAMMDIASKALKVTKGE